MIRLPLLIWSGLMLLLFAGKTFHLLNDVGNRNFFNIMIILGIGNTININKPLHQSENHTPSKDTP
jgi:hypothetical protein